MYAMKCMYLNFEIYFTVLYIYVYYTLRLSKSIHLNRYYADTCTLSVPIFPLYKHRIINQRGDFYIPFMKYYELQII